MKKITLITLISVIMIFSLSMMVFAETYIVGTSAGFPPFEYVEDGEIVGFDVDLIRAIAESQGFEVEVKDLSFDSLIAGVKTGNLDIIAAGMTITAEREKAVDFSDPYYGSNQSIIVKEGSGKDMTVIFGDNDLGVQTGTTGDSWVTDNLAKKGVLKGRVKHFDTFVMVLNDLVNENLDGVVLDTPVAERFASMKPVKIVGEIITGEEYGIAVQEGNTELLNKINAGLEDVKESGKFNELIAKYFQ